jgi:hypothetical protein
MQKFLHIAKSEHFAGVCNDATVARKPAYPYGLADAAIVNAEAALAKGF